MEVAAGGALLSVTFKKVFEILASSDVRHFGSKKKVRSQLQIWEGKLRKIHAVLEDAEDKQNTINRVKIWFDELRDLVYDAEDVLDEFAIEALRLKLKNNQQQVTKLLPANYFTGFKFNAVMSSKLKKITERLDIICDEMSKLNLVEKAVGGERSGRSDSDGAAILPTTSVLDYHVFGRDKDKKDLLHLLLATGPTDAAVATGGGVPVIPILGMGGLGKTTLAQQLYNDDEVRGYFDLRAWVCVSDTFDIVKITKTIIQSFDERRQTSNDDTLDQLQVKLGSIVSGKKFLVILDDVWNEKYEAWTVLHKSFKGGAVGSKIVVTTRNLEVVKTMSDPSAAHSLGELPFDDCMSLFALHALGATNFDGHPDLKDIGENIVRKCKGLPLAAKALGGLLRSELRPCEWRDILDSRIWELPEDKCDILPALRLSYQHLPSHLKQCFAYCATFPKDYEFNMDELVMLWMAQSFLPQVKQEKHLQDVGVQFFRDLLSRSFFQYSSKQSTRFVMHDLIHDLAQYVAGEICFHLDAKLKTGEHPSTIQKIRHSSFTCSYYEVSGRFRVFEERKALRTLLALSVEVSSSYNWISIEVLNRLLLKLKKLRALSLISYWIREVPESINSLKHLRYLNLSCTDIRLLPEFVCSLLNLQTLLLRGCKELEKLPTRMGNLTYLCHLDISETPKLKEMPVGIGNLTDLCTLGKFIVGVGGGDGLNIRELKDLSHLKGKLSIQELHNVGNYQHAREADLQGKEGLERLMMEWNKDNSDEKADSDVAAKVLEMLQPHKNLKTLAIKFYCGREFPSWIGDPSSMSNIIELELRNCWKSTSLPSLGRLPLLKHLTIQGMKAIKSVGFEFYGGVTAFPVLETLKFRNMLGWEKWCSSEGEWKFPRLRELEILNCPLLIGECRVSLPSLCQLKLESCNESLLRCMFDLTSLTTLNLREMSGFSCPILIEECVVSLPSLCQLKLENCNESVLRCMIDLASLTTLRIKKMPGLCCLHQSVGQMMVALKHLELHECEDLTCLWQIGAGLEENFKCLTSLDVRRCPQLVSFLTTSTIKKMASLEKVIVMNFPDIVQQQEENGFPRKLSHVELEDCGGEFIESMVNGLMRRPQDGNSVVVEHLKIKSCDSLQHLEIKSAGGGNKIKRLNILDCKNLVSLCNSGEGVSGDVIFEIEVLDINGCPSLKTDEVKLFVGGGVKNLKLEECDQLESLPEECIMSTFRSSSKSAKVEDIEIMFCPNLKRLPDSLHSLTNLTFLLLFRCNGIERFPESGLPIPNLKSLNISCCENLKTLPKNMHALTSLERLKIWNCSDVESITEEQGCLPPNLIELEIKECSNMKQSMTEWGLHTLTSLQELTIREVPKLPEDEKTLTTTLQLPTTLRTLWIDDFKVESITSTSWGIQNLTSLTILRLWFCPKLRYLSKKCFPPTLEQLEIWNCPIVAKKCSEGNGKYWPRISLIPKIDIS